MDQDRRLRWLVVGTVTYIVGTALEFLTPSIGPAVELANRVAVVLLYATSIVGLNIAGNLTDWSRVRGWFSRRWRETIDHLKNLPPRFLIVPLTTICLALGIGITGVVTELVSDKCSKPTMLRMAASSDLLDTARALALRFVEVRSRSGCAQFEIHVYEADPDKVISQLRPPADWSLSSGALTEIGPQPDIWLTGPVAGLSAAGSDVRRIATTPIIIGIPAVDSESENPLEPEISAQGWVDVVDGLRAQGTRLVAPDLRTTDVGLLASASARSSSTTDDNANVLIALERLVGDSLDEGGFPLGEAEEVLCRIREIAARDTNTEENRVAVITTERDVGRVNRGEALGDCGRGPTRETDAPLLTGIYPRDARSLDVQLVRPSWTNQSTQQQQAASDFVDWVAGNEGAEVLSAAHLRPIIGAPQRLGYRPPALRTPAALSEEELRETRAQLEEVRPRGRILFAVDTSGSMNSTTPAGSRLRSVSDALVEAFDQAGAQDFLGLWTFPDGTGTAPDRAITTGPALDTRQSAEEALQAAQAAGNTPLFRTMVDAVVELGSSDQNARNTVVVVTDGEDTTSRVGAQEAVDAAKRLRVRLVVVTIGEVQCSNEQFSALSAGNGPVECRDADIDALPDTVLDIVERRWDR